MVRTKSTIHYCHPWCKENTTRQSVIRHSMLLNILCTATHQILYDQRHAGLYVQMSNIALNASRKRRQINREKITTFKS